MRKSSFILLIFGTAFTKEKIIGLSCVFKIFIAMKEKISIERF